MSKFVCAVCDDAGYTVYPPRPIVWIDGTESEPRGTRHYDDLRDKEHVAVPRSEAEAAYSPGRPGPSRQPRLPASDPSPSPHAVSDLVGSLVEHPLHPATVAHLQECFACADAADADRWSA